MRPALILVLLMALGDGAAAQEAAPEQAPETQAEAEPEAAATPEPAATPAPAPDAAAKSPDSFTPSEEISEDLPVSFPVDI